MLLTLFHDRVFHVKRPVVFYTDSAISNKAPVIELQACIQALHALVIGFLF